MAILPFLRLRHFFFPLSTWDVYRPVRHQRANGFELVSLSDHRGPL